MGVGLVPDHYERLLSLREHPKVVFTVEISTQRHEFHDDVKENQNTVRTRKRGL